MANITVRNQGEVESSGKVNWRGDQSVVPQGGQSIYKTSSVQLAALGSRKVVGDRVFRYAKASGGAGAGDLCEFNGTVLDSVTAGGTNVAGGKTFTWYAATTIGANDYAEGYLACQSGTAANMGQFYRVKSHDAIAKTCTGTLNLYDELKITADIVDEWILGKNMYASVVECTSGASHIPIGVAPVAVTTNDYFWLQTWGPCMVKAGTAAALGELLIADATGQVTNLDNKSSGGDTMMVLGQAMMVHTASENGLAFIQIAP